MHDIPSPKEQTPAVADAQNNRGQIQHGWGIHPTDQRTVAVITAVAIAAIAGSWLYRGGLSGRLIDIETAAPVQVTFRLDINSADWPEWTVLPGVGETLAKRIVRYRSERGPFRHHAELLQVSGIGPRTFDRMRPYLLPLPPIDDLPEQDVAAEP
ncbi:MAG: helix-hairpin-helix domain-containing protein [Planctomycetota bacterium]